MSSEALAGICLVLLTTVFMSAMALVMKSEAKAEKRLPRFNWDDPLADWVQTELENEEESRGA